MRRFDATRSTSPTPVPTCVTGTAEFTAPRTADAACRITCRAKLNHKSAAEAAAEPTTARQKDHTLARRAGATYVSPFIGRLDDIGQNGMTLIASIAEIFDIHQIKTEIIAASVRHPLHVTDAALSGAHIATIPYKVLAQLVHHPLTDKGLEQFLADWKNANPNA